MKHLSGAPWVQSLLDLSFVSLSMQTSMRLERGLVGVLLPKEWSPRYARGTQRDVAPTLSETSLDFL